MTASLPPDGQAGEMAASSRQPIPPRLPAPIVTYALLGLTILVYIAQLGSQLLLGFDLPAALGIKVNALIAAGQWWRLLTPMLLHGSVMHIVFNMYALLIFGPGLEQHYGRGRFLLLYLIGGFAGNVVSTLFSDANSLGSSTAIFGLFAAQAVFVYRNRALFGDRAAAALRQMAVLAGINFIIGLSPGIDNWGHLGGFVGGGLFAWWLGPVWEIREDR